MAQSAPPHAFLPLSPAAFNILLSLADGEKHGYAIMLDVEASTGGQMRLGPGTLYGNLKRMLESGLIEEASERPDPALDDERRRYYRLSFQGRKALKTEAERLAAQVALARARDVLGGETQ